MKVTFVGDTRFRRRSRRKPNTRFWEILQGNLRWRSRRELYDNFNILQAARISIHLTSPMIISIYLTDLQLQISIYLTDFQLQISIYLRDFQYTRCISEGILTFLRNSRGRYIENLSRVLIRWSNMVKKSGIF